MKTVLRSLFFLSLLGFGVTKANAQCTVSDIIVQNIVPIGGTATTCTVKFDATFNIANNSGNKFIFLHAWLESAYPNYFQCVNGLSTINGSIAAPRDADLVNSFINIGLDNTTPTPTILTTYPNGSTTTMTTVTSVTKVVLPDGSANITLYGVTVTVPVPCGTPVVIVADLWSSQSANASRAHCVNCGIRSSAGYLNTTGFVNCTPAFVGSITNLTAIPISGYYRVFADINNDGYFTPVSDTLLISNTNFTVAANGTISISGPIPVANINQNIFIVVTQTTGSANGASRVIVFRSLGCTPLPVSFKSFSASRINRTNVMLKWETITEINNRGFYIQRSTANNIWETATFIPTQATSGNSSSLLTYSFNDVNANKGITQYRIQQVDLDGRAKYSEIRAVRGDGQQQNVIVYPTPSADGHVNVLFEEKGSVRDITLTDMNGRILKQWNALSNNTLQIENLGSGMYLLKVIVRETGYQTIERIIVSK